MNAVCSAQLMIFIQLYLVPRIVFAEDFQLWCSLLLDFSDPYVTFLLALIILLNTMFSI
jgi:hypothetical protein